RVRASGRLPRALPEAAAGAPPPSRDTRLPGGRVARALQGRPPAPGATHAVGAPGDVGHLVGLAPVPVAAGPLPALAALAARAVRPPLGIRGPLCDAHPLALSLGNGGARAQVAPRGDPRRARAGGCV